MDNHNIHHVPDDWHVWDNRTVQKVSAVLTDLDQRVTKWTEEENTREASEKTRIADEDERIANEKQRVEDFEESQTYRAETFKASEDEREQIFKDNEGDETSKDETSRWGKFYNAQVQRGNDFNEFEDGLLESYRSAEAARDDLYKKTEGTSESTDDSRWGKYNAAEEARDNDYETKVKPEVDALNEKVHGNIDYKDLSESARQQIEAKGGGTITNNPDEEDLTVSNNKLKFKDRDSSYGKGYIILRMDKTFSEQLIKSNTIYEIRYSYDLGGKEVTIPDGCVLKFEGGKLSNGTIVGQNTVIEAQPVQIFTPEIVTSGIWSVSKLHAEWYGYADGDDISSLLDGKQVSTMLDLNGKSYTITKECNCQFNTIINGTIVIDYIGNGLIYKGVNRIILLNLTITATKNYSQETASWKYTSVYMKNCKDIIVSNCNFNYSEYGLSLDDCDKGEISNCDFGYSTCGAFNVGSDMNDDTTTGCNLISIHNNKFYNGYEGIKGAFYVSNIDVYGNECYNNQRDGIDFACLVIDGLNIHDNFIHNNSNNGMEVKVLDSSTYIPKTGTTLKYDKVNIHDNTIDGQYNNYSGITIQCDSSEIEIFNLDIHDNFIKGSSARCMRINTWVSTSNVKVYNNNISSDRASVTAGISLIHANASVFNNYIKIIQGNAIYLENQSSTDENYKSLVYGNYIETGDNGICFKIDSSANNCVLKDNRMLYGLGQYPIQNSSTCTMINNILDDVLSEFTDYPKTDNDIHYRVSPGIKIFFKDPITAGYEAVICTANSMVNAGTSSSHFIKIVPIS